MCIRDRGKDKNGEFSDSIGLSKLQKYAKMFQLDKAVSYTHLICTKTASWNRFIGYDCKKSSP